MIMIAKSNEKIRAKIVITTKDEEDNSSRGKEFMSSGHIIECNN